VPNKFRVVCISDTHLRTPTLPPGDVLIHAGDSTTRGTFDELRRAAQWFHGQPHEIKIWIAGNHDRGLDIASYADGFRANVGVMGAVPGAVISDPALVRAAERIMSGAGRGAHYLRDTEVYVHTSRGGGPLYVYGSPWQPEFNDWAFNLPRKGRELAARWAAIPSGLDVLITHGPPFGILDRTSTGEHAGCELLRAAVERARPRLHVFGHVHEGYGVVERDGTIYVNASICDLSYRPVNAPVVVDL